jgi:RNA polymerase primary sigma factor
VGSTATAALKDTEMAQPEDPGDCPIPVPANIIDTVNKVVRTSRQMLPELGREPAPEELAERLAMPLEKLRKVLAIARQPIPLETWIGGEPDPHLG